MLLDYRKAKDIYRNLLQLFYSPADGSTQRQSTVRKSGM